MGNQTCTLLCRQFMIKYNINQNVVTYILHTTDLDVVIHQSYMDYCVMDALQTTLTPIH